MQALQLAASELAKRAPSANDASTRKSVEAWKSGSGAPHASPKQLELVDARMIVGWPEPAVLPEPERDPAAFALVRFRCKVAGNNLFLQRPRVAATYRAHEVRFMAAYRDAREALDDALQRGLPAAECSARFEHFRAFETWPSAEEIGRLDAERPASFDASPPRNFQAANSDLFESSVYRRWIGLLMAEAANPQGLPSSVTVPSAGGRVEIFYREWRRRVLGSAVSPATAAGETLRIVKEDVAAAEGKAEVTFLKLLQTLARSGRRARCIARGVRRGLGASSRRRSGAFGARLVADSARSRRPFPFRPAGTRRPRGARSAQPRSESRLGHTSKHCPA